MHDTTILGHVIPKGTLVVMSTNSSFEDEANPMHTLGPMTGERPPIHPLGPATKTEPSGEANDRKAKKVGQWKAGTGRMFDPDRWMRDGVFDPNAGPSLPFSLGQRGCFGKSLAVSPVWCLIPRREIDRMLVDGTSNVLACPQSGLLLCPCRTAAERL